MCLELVKPRIERKPVTLRRPMTGANQCRLACGGEGDSVMVNRGQHGSLPFQ
jgi:hypothetical protein